ncbi:MAG TPA: SET domain-containing protein-lysine N-methyltransferase, partial [Chitinophagaceae bacterium]|nr:SET domain-containing protein-lysine N-methyltransferase [Chitinophagaceae bacterium]
LEMLNLPYTGPNEIIYDPSKPLMKYVAYCAGVKTPNYVEIRDNNNIEAEIQNLTFPLFIKPANAGDSLGVDENSLVHNLNDVKNKINSLLEDEYDQILIEEYIAGREFTVLVAASPDLDNCCKVFKPVEYVFQNDKQFKTYALKTSSLHTDANVACDNKLLEEKLKHASEKIFTGFSGVGYARLDFRVDANDEIYFLDINFTCSVFYEDGYEGSADYILKYDPIGTAGFLKNIIEEGIARHASKQKKYILKGNSLDGYGIFANQFIKKGEIIFKQEASAQHIVTRRYVEKNWTPDQVRDFKKYAYPISDEVYILWDNDPQKWAPQNHSCEANTGYDGLNLIALCDIKNEDELTLDYQELLDNKMDAFTCKCGSKNCRKKITGIPGNSISNRENQNRLMRSAQTSD